MLITALLIHPVSCSEKQKLGKKIKEKKKKEKRGIMKTH